MSCCKTIVAAQLIHRLLAGVHFYAIILVGNGKMHKKWIKFKKDFSEFSRFCSVVNLLFSDCYSMIIAQFKISQFYVTYAI